MDPEQIPTDLLAEEVLAEQTPAAPAEVSAEDRKKVIDDWMKAYTPPPPAPAPAAPVAPFTPQAPAVEEDEDGLTIAQVIEKAVQRATAPLLQQANQTQQASGAMAAESIIRDVTAEYGLNAEEVKELRSITSQIHPSQLLESFGNSEVKKRMAAQARGMATFNAPPAPAPTTRTTGSGIRFAEGITQGDLDKYMLWQGIEKLTKAHLADLKENGYIV